ncbi:hypothetical protein B0H17DRAFT_1124606 [Mycena rosella]|uniref:Uncharacterized protein n=1 Tax=Mycena rosella TaxID=1033263 RepID=A0AAD7H000_MYCRO|nr:hypothetical protein B0H17DRAFT_1124606 [Mycena rosella]
MASSPLVNYSNSWASDDVCPLCGVTFLTKPRASVGHHTPTNDRRKYQKCLNNTFRPDSLCTGFIWCNDLPRDDLPLPREEQSSVSQPSSGAPPTPQTPSRAPKQNCANPLCPRLKHRDGHRNTRCINQYRKGCCKDKGNHCPAPNHNEPAVSVLNSVTVVPRSPAVIGASSSSSSSRPAIPLSYEKPMARMIDPAYAQKHLSGEHDVAQSNRFQREKYRKAAVNNIKIQWWTEDNDAETLVVTAPLFPMFLPKDCPAIVGLVGLDKCTTYAYWDGNIWIRTDLPIELKANTTVFLWSLHVKLCDDGPSVTRVKRRLSDMETPTPTRPRLEHDNFRPVIAPINFGGSGGSQTIPTISILSDSEDDEDPCSPIEVIDSRHAVTSDPSHQTSSPTPSAGTFPLKYACEMDEGFKNMDVLPGKIAARFKAVFNTPFKKATYYDHHTPWSQMSPNDLSAVAILRAFLHVRSVRDRSNPVPLSFTDAVDCIVAQPGITVNWSAVVHGEQASGEAGTVDKIMRQYFDDKFLKIPVGLEALVSSPPSSPLSDNPLESPHQAGAEKTKQQESASGGQNKDPSGDVKLHDLKVILVNLFGDDFNDISVTRLHNLDLNDHLSYYGQVKMSSKFAGDDEPGLKIPPSDLEEGFTVSVNSRALVEAAIVNRQAQVVPQDKPYQVQWSLPGFPAWDDALSVLMTYHPEDVPTYQWAENLPDHLPAIGPTNALRVQLTVVMYRRPNDAPPTVTELAIQYLVDTYRHNKIVKEIRAANSDPQTKHKGRDPACWALWLDKINTILSAETRVPASVLNDVANKKLALTHYAGLFKASTTWVTQCSETAKILQKKQRTQGVSEFLKKTQKPVHGIDKFKAVLEAFK